MIGDWSIGEQVNFKKSISIYFYRRDGNRPVLPLTINIMPQKGTLDKRVRVHPNSKVDIAAIEITDFIPEVQKLVDLEYIKSDMTYLVEYNDLPGLGIGMGNLVYAIGYPAGIFSKTDNKPIAKVGYISSTTDADVKVDLNFMINDKQKKVETDGHILLVDGLIVGGNSGGPLIIGKGYRYITDDKGKRLRTKEQIPNLILGIVSGGIPGKGISIIYSSSHIIELVESYYK